MSYQLVIEPSAFARKAGLLQGDLPIADLPRVLDMLAGTSGAIGYRVEGHISERERPQLLLRLEGVLCLRCQRCLESVTYPLRVCNVIEFVGDESSLIQKEIEDDSRDFLPWQDEIDVVALIEDEVILALPLVPRHEHCDLPASEQAMEANVASSPFFVLEGLKGSRTN